MTPDDFQELEEAYRYLPEPTRLCRLDRDAVLKAHYELDERERSLDAAGHGRTRRIIIGGGKHYSIECKVEHLGRLKLSDGSARIDEVALGKFLLCRIAVRPVRTASIQLVVETLDGFFVPVSLFRVPIKLGADDLRQLFPLGAVFAIREPFFRSNRDGYYVRVESPADFHRVYPGSSLLEADFVSKHALARCTPEECKAVGNKAFQAHRWHAAKEAYTWAISSLPSTAGLEPTSTNLRATLLSNLAMTNLKLSLPFSARQNCLSALESFAQSTTTAPSTPLERKLLYRLALSLYSLGEFTDCISTLTSPSLDSASPDAETAALLRRAQHRLLEKSQAAFDFAQLYRQARDGPGSPLDVADYFATDAFDIATIVGKGKGLVAKRSIRRGELLMVCKPVAAVAHNLAQRSLMTQYLTGINLWTRSEDPSTVNEVISEIAWNVAQGEEETTTTATSLWAGKEVEDSGATERSGRDVSRLEGCVTFNGFKIEDLAANRIGHEASATSETEKPSPPTALYPVIPSALNHSCLANTSYTFLGSLFVLRARHDIVAGEELVVSYVDSKASLEDREDKLGRHGFVCRCDLCEEERRTDTRVRRERETLRDRAASVSEDDDASIERLLRLKGTLEQSYGPASRARHPLYTVNRLLSQRYASRGRYCESIAVERDGLASLGTKFEGLDRVRLVSAPLVGDTDAVLSSLWISKMHEMIHETAAAKSWKDLAKEIERGQAGTELFELRYDQ